MVVACFQGTAACSLFTVHYVQHVRKDGESDRGTGWKIRDLSRAILDDSLAVTATYLGRDITAHGLGTGDRNGKLSSPTLALFVLLFAF